MKYLLYNKTSQCWVKFDNDSSMPFNNVSDIKNATEMNIDECISVITMMQLQNHLVIIPAPLYNLTSERVTQIAIQDMILESASKLKEHFVMQEAIMTNSFTDEKTGEIESFIEDKRTELTELFKEDINEYIRKNNTT